MNSAIIPLIFAKDLPFAKNIKSHLIRPNIDATKLVGLLMLKFQIFASDFGNF